MKTRLRGSPPGGSSSQIAYGAASNEHRRRWDRRRSGEMQCTVGASTKPGSPGPVFHACQSFDGPQARSRMRPDTAIRVFPRRGH
eukprot:2883315-Pyramimonas_sp.AAC.1